MDIQAMAGCCFQAIFPFFICLGTLRARAACFLTCLDPTAHAAPPLRVQNTPFILAFLQGPGSATQGSLSDASDAPAQDIGQEVLHDSCPISTPVGLWHILLDIQWDIPWDIQLEWDIQLDRLGYSAG